ncbi:MAG: hypothetical protein ABSA12_13405 [Verrucomicrobiia bacterium]
MKAKVFLSCGQSRESDEAGIAAKVADGIRELGFDCYIAVAEQSLLGLRENIFYQLNTADYFVFIDFKRERLDVARANIHRGSLFSHQELAVASFLQIPALVLQEDGVNPLDGMSGAIQGNATPFSDRQHIASIVAEQLRQRLERNEWSTQTHNALTLHLPPQSFSDALQPQGGLLRHFQVSVRNNHWRRHALECFAYLEAAEDLLAARRIQLETIEFKWAGSTLPSVRIGPVASRRFDAFQFTHTNPINLGFKLFTDSTEFCPRLERSCKYKLTFVVVSQNFEPARKSFILQFGHTLDSIGFEEDE